MYRLSKYNYFAEHGQRVVYLNGITGAVFSVSIKEHENLTKQFSDLISFYIHYNSIFSRFKDWGFIVDEDIDEIDLLRFRNRQAILLDKVYRLIINPTEDCIFNCWYCTQRVQNGGFMKKKIQDKVKKHIDFMIEKEKITGLFLDWFGGEPIMYFDEVIYPLAEHAFEATKQNQLSFIHHVTTNAYLLNTTMIEQMKKISLKSFQITIDGDKKRHNFIRNINGKPSYDRIIENIIMLCEQIPDVSITLRLNFDEQTLLISNMKTVFEQIPSKYRQNIFPDFQRVWQTKKGKMDENPILFNIYKQCDSLGYNSNIPGGFKAGISMKCYADRYYHSVINYNGKVYKCTLSTNGKEEGILHDNGEIEWDQKLLVNLYSNATFENERCLKCKYMPLCFGPCSQVLKNKSNLPCYLDMSEFTITQFIIETYNKHNKVIIKNRETNSLIV
jgi:uncharacterized protein